MVPLCPILSSAEWAGFPERLEMFCRSQGHAGQRLSLAILLFMWFHLCAAQHRAGGKGLTSFSVCNSCVFWYFYLTMHSQFLLWEGTVADVRDSSKAGRIYLLFNQFSCSKERDFFLLIFAFLSVFVFFLRIWTLFLFFFSIVFHSYYPK